MAASTPRSISNPRRLLILAPDTDAHATVPLLLHELTGHAVQLTSAAAATTTTTTTTAPPTPPSATVDGNGHATKQDEQDKDHPVLFTDSLAGYVSHPPLRIRTKYYSADIPIWVDEVPLSSAMLPSEPSTPTSEDPLGKRKLKRRVSSSSISDEGDESSSLAEWKNMFLGDDAEEVRDAIGAIVICVSQPKDGVCSSLVPKELIPVDAQDRQDMFEKTYKDAIKAIVEVKARIEQERELTGGEVPGVLIVLEKEDQDTKGSANKVGTAVPDITTYDDDDRLTARSAAFSADWWDEELSQMGIFELEVVGWDGSISSPTLKNEGKGKKNQFGELMGMERARQVLETHEWNSPTVDDSGYNDDSSDGESGNDGESRNIKQSKRRSVIADLLGADSDEENDAKAAFDADMIGLDSEMAGLHMSLMEHDEHGQENEHGHGSHPRFGDSNGNGFEENEEAQVEQFAALMQRVQALKDMNTADLPYEERKRMARKAVEDIMKTI
ncbi:Alpha/gamma-adaptin-binding protein p34 [Ascosphaera apis ARSEF 7405]|uniref:Alpha/gamma-adaptin-binding protein p34 n=1 Tax=Ascosphaera apis ARSEF 7405 TaxID=392613 RepID=A0A168AX09_9EURO|nr:Alpha/gamma-adaptin-binding protein p34 [Ascosphaera apis ARSEF 7405]